MLLVVLHESGSFLDRLNKERQRKKYKQDGTSFKVTFNLHTERERLFLQLEALIHLAL